MKTQIRNTFFSRLESRTRAVNSLLCVGLDPHPQDLSNPTGAAARDFCLRLIEATQDLAAAYKPNAAFFEALGPVGWAALQEVITAVPDHIPVLLDAKRGDIASTARAYAQSVFHTLGADAVTINPYLGRDSVTPFTADPEKGIFLLCKTSNPGAGDLQDLPLGQTGLATLYEYVAHLAQSWNTNDNIGLVVGATQLEALARVRDAAPDLWFLAPGVGAQGADLEGALRAGLRPDGMGMLVPVSRGIWRASDPRQVTVDLREAINNARAKITHHPSPTPNPQSPIPNPQLADALLSLGCVRFGEFTLKSGLQSPIYVDLRRLIADPRVLAQAAAAYLPILRTLEFDHLAALPYAAMPIATAISLQGGWPMIYPRKEAKSYGTKAQVEGVFQPGEKAVVIDDVISTGGSKIEGAEKLIAAGLRVEDIVVLVDRGMGGDQFMAERGFRLHTVFTLPELLDYWERNGQVEADKIAAVREFLLPPSI
ncbi:MAG: orotidine-5'-phosphate decarboxylase [Anaerolineales bacterium]